MQTWSEHIAAAISSTGARMAMRVSLREKDGLTPEHKYRQVFECLGDAVFLTDEFSGKTIDTNRRAETLLGCSRSEILGRRQSHFLPSLDQGMSFTESVISEMARADGSLLPVRISSTRLTVYDRPLVLRLCHEMEK